MILASLLGCHPDPGQPDYPTRVPWVIDDDDFYDDPLAPGEERLSLGVFYESVATESYIIDDVENHFYIYESTFSLQTTDERYEGYTSDQVTHGALAWWGGGIHWDVPRDLSEWDALHLAVKTGNMTDWQVGVTGGGVETRVSVADYGVVADDAWHVILIPLADLEASDLGAVSVPLLLVGETGATGESFLLDDVYYTRGGK